MNYWNGTPLFRFLLLFICGILPAIYFPFLNNKTAILLCCLLIGVFFLQFIFRKKIAIYHRRWARGAVSYAAFFIAGYVITLLCNERNDHSHFRNFKHTAGIIGYLNEPLSEKSNSFKTVLKVLYVNDGIEWKPTTGNCLTYFSKDSASSKLQYGDMIIWSGNPSEVKAPANPSQFNYKRWLQFNQIFDQGFIPAGKWKLLDHHSGYRLAAYSYSLRNKLLKVFRDNNITGQDYAVLSALILGYEAEIDQEVFNAYAASGALHVLSVSGLHVGIIFIAINFFLGFLDANKRTRLLKSIIIILFLWFYALLTGLSPSVLRSATMLSFIVIGRMTTRHTSLYNTLAASAFFLLGINPFLIMQVGFQLSYLAVLGIILLQPMIQSWIDPPGWLLRNLWSLLSVSIAAQVSTFPLGFYYFHQFPVYFLLANLIVIPISTVIIYGGILLLIISPWHIGGFVVGHLLGSLIRAMNAMVMYIEQLPVSIINGISISVFETYALYLSMVAFLLFFSLKNQRYLLLGVCGILCIFSSQVIEAYRIYHREQIIVYSVKGKSFVNIMDGRENLILADSATVLNRSLMLSNVYNYWWDCGLNEKRAEIIDESFFRRNNICYYRNFLMYKNFRIGFVRDTVMHMRGAGKTVIDFLVLSGNLRTKVKHLMEHFTFKQLIIDSSVAPGGAMRLLNEAKELGIAAYSVQHRGAFVFDLSQE